MPEVCDSERGSREVIFGYGLGNDRCSAIVSREDRRTDALNVHGS